ncbi:hypothetical protein LIER_06874 [Lithospermum erythrorhizon]|uniref:Uncharacterized protein n=1 Tax=Lithospermum erythrorhizon TaxID=34254 RepID=A0AAV3PAR7_LITER
MTRASPEELNNSFSHFQLRATECTYGLSLKWKEAESSLAKLANEKSSLEERLNVALSQADNVESKIPTDFPRLKAQLDSSQLLLAGTEKRLEELSSRPSPEVVVKAFKKSDTYRDLLIDNTVSIIKEFNSEVYPKFHGIHSISPKFVKKTFRKEYVVDLTDSEEEDTESTDLGDDDSFDEDAPPEDALLA